MYYVHRLLHLYNKEIFNTEILLFDTGMKNVRRYVNFNPLPNWHTCTDLD